MTDESTLAPAPETPSFAPKLYGIALLVAAICAIGFTLVMRFTAMDLGRDMQNWQDKLSLIAESRTSAVDQWVSGQFKDLRSMADNPSLQLYLTQMQMNAAPTDERPAVSEQPAGDSAQKTYLRNLLLFTAERSGFAPAGNPEAIPANVEQASKNGLAILGNDNQIVVSTLITPSTKDVMLAEAAKQPAGQEKLIDIRKDGEGSLYMGFIVPIYAIQGERDAASQIGKVVGIKTVDASLFSLLKDPGATEKSLETILVRQDDGKLDYLSPLEDDSSALSKQTEDNPAVSSAAALVRTPGNFSSTEKDYRDKPVLATSRAVAGTPWILITKIDRQEALANGEQRRAGLMTFFFMMIAAIVLIIIAVWRHAQSRRSMMMSHYFRHMAAQSRAQEQLLRLVADNQPEPIYIVDMQQTYRFANRKTAEDADTTPENIPGKTLADIRGSARAEQVNEQCKKAMTLQQVVYDVLHTEEDREEKIIRSAYVPLDHIPIVTLPEHTPGVLVVEQDITEVMHERERRLNTQQQLVQTLIKLVDRRDPFAANHSLLVSQIAYEIATDMDLDNVTVETARIAGSLMNIGKIVVPPELLTKSESLTTQEKTIIRESMDAAADLIKNISFDGPVAETLRQWQEKWDGSGPLGMKGDDILISARIIAVTNAFIGMISPRSWRTAIPIESATKFLLDESDKNFDRRVVVALVNYVENHSGKAWIQQIINGQRNVA